MIKLNKIEARKAFIDGHTIRVVPCKMHPENHWPWYYDLNAIDEENRLAVNSEYKKLDRVWLFNNWVTRWYYYNAGYEQGYYPAFYLVD